MFNVTQFSEQISALHLVFILSVILFSHLAEFYSNPCAFVDVPRIKIKLLDKQIEDYSPIKKVEMINIMPLCVCYKALCNLLTPKH